MIFISLFTFLLRAISPHPTQVAKWLASALDAANAASDLPLLGFAAVGEDTAPLPRLASGALQGLCLLRGWSLHA